jgi:hypothetical protein
VLAREDATQADFVAALTDVITQTAYIGGFVVDGLDALPEHSDIDQFLCHALTMCRLDAELARNPVYIVQHPFLTARAGACGHSHLTRSPPHLLYRTAGDRGCVAHAEHLADVSLRWCTQKQEQEKAELFTVSETQSSALPEPGKVAIDERRTQIRPCLLKIALEPITETDEGRQHHRHTSRGGLRVKCM